jgi:hypothetical protein
MVFEFVDARIIAESAAKTSSIYSGTTSIADTVA